ncbi:MAG: hypothetical protein ACJ8AW_10735 [Rhodopila sp.]
MIKAYLGGEVETAA